MTTGRIHSIAQRTLALALLPAALALPAAAHAHAGAVDHGFGDHGVVAFDTPPGGLDWKGVGGIWPGGGGRVVLSFPDSHDVLATDSGPLRRLDARGRPDAAFGAGGILALPLALAASDTRLPGGGWLLGRAEAYATLRPYDRDGRPAPSADAFAATIVRLAAGGFDDVLPLGDGTVLEVHAPPAANAVDVTRVGLDGRVRGAAVTDALPGGQVYGGPLAKASSGDGVLAWSPSGIYRFRADGTLDPRWGTRGFRFLGADRIELLASWERTRAVVVERSDTTSRSRLAWLDARGRVIRTRALEASSYEDLAQGRAIATDPQGRTLVARTYDHARRITLTRLRSNGRTDTSFGRRGTVHLSPGRPVGVRSIAVLPDGRIAVAGSLLRYEPNRTFDREDFPTPGYLDAGTVVWRLRAR